MPAFITPVVSILPSTRARELRRCAAARKPRRVATYPAPARAPRAELTGGPSSSSTGSEPDDDDTDFGSNPAYGLVLPDLSDADRAYLDAARSDKEFMRRMTEIAHRIDRNRHTETEVLGRQTAEDYIENLSQRTRDGTLEEAAAVGQVKRAPSPPPQQQQQQQTDDGAGSAPAARDESVPQPAPEPQQTDPEAETEADIEAQIEALQRQIMEAADAPPPVVDPATVEVPQTPEELAEAAQQLGELTSKIRSEVGLDDADTPPAPAAAAAPRPDAEAGASLKPGTVEKQIDYLERYLERLQQEAADEGDAEKFAEDAKGGGAAAGATTEEEDGEDGGPAEVDSLIEQLHEKVTRTPDKQAPIPSAPQPGASDRAVDGPAFVGLESKAGELSPDEKRAAFMELRRRAMAARGETDDDDDGGMGMGMAGDPFNVTLPEKKVPGREGDFSDGALSRADDGAAERRLQALRRQAAVDEFGESDTFAAPPPPPSQKKRVAGDGQGVGAGAAPSGDEREFDSFGAPMPDKTQLVEQIEAEVKAYVADAHESLKQHEARLSILLSKLMASDGW